jgi:RNA polymerase sigma-70 factor (ECF subfamily)
MSPFLPVIPLYDEKELLQQVANGSEAAFTTLFEHYQPNIYSIAYKLTRQAPLAEETVQDVFLKIWVRRESLPQIEFFPAFLFKVAENTIYSTLRKLYREKEQKEAFRLQPAATALNYTEDAVLQKQYDQLLDQAIARLPEKQRQTYELVRRQGLRREEAAVLLQVSPETVKSNLDQALRNIRAYCMAHTELSLYMLLFLAVR